jgi:hypothetical protein
MGPAADSERQIEISGRKMEVSERKREVWEVQKPAEAEQWLTTPGFGKCRNLQRQSRG